MESPGLRLYLLGTSRIQRHNLPIRLPTRKAQSLLAYLVLHPTEHSREKLAALFWGDSTDQEAKHSLRVALAMLRSHLGENLLLAGRETVQINPDYLIWVDVLEFEARATQVLATNPPDPTAINLDLYQGDLLPDLYDDWVISERERYRQLYLDLLLHLAQHWRSQGEYRRVIDLASRVLAQDPANEAAHQHLMFSHFAAHDRNAALKQYEACVRSLRDELGVDPSPETQALYRRIKSAPPPGPSRTDHTNNLPIPLTSFIGREQEIAELKRLLTHAENETHPPPTRLLTLTGPGGCGKTRLAIQVANELADSYRDGVWWVDLAPLTEDRTGARSRRKDAGRDGGRATRAMGKACRLSPAATRASGVGQLRTGDLGVRPIWPSHCCPAVPQCKSWRPAGRRWACSVRSHGCCLRFPCQSRERRAILTP